jgi:LysR family carnitine catabolism transcriptional activator
MTINESINWSSRELDVFLTLVDTLSFRRTAERMHLSQPAVTGVISRIEESLQVKLFDRTTRQVQLTGPGLVFVEQAQRLRSMAEDAVRAVRDVATLQIGQVTMAARPLWPPPWCPWPLPNLPRPFRACN